MQVVPYLVFAGQCEAAFKFYADCLNGRILTKMTFGSTPIAAHMPTDWQDKLVHAHLQVGERELMGSDAPPDRYQRPAGISVSLQFTDPAEAERVFKALSVNGTVQMPLEQTFWAKRFGALVDQFGIPWMINCA